MSGGFPERISFDELGPVLRDRRRVTDPETQLSAARINPITWQVAGMNRTCALVTLTVAANGTRTSGGEAWNDKDDVTKRVAITHPNTGEYVITAQAATYEDWSGTPRAVIFYGAIITALSSTSVRPPTYTLDSATQITVRTFNAAGSAADMPFTVDVK